MDRVARVPRQGHARRHQRLREAQPQRVRPPPPVEPDLAQRVAQALRAAGFRYYVTEEAPPGTAPAEAAARGFGTYSARYGNLYYTRQLVQLFDRAYGTFQPELTAWRRADGRFVDPFRPTIEPEGFDDEPAVTVVVRQEWGAVLRLSATSTEHRLISVVATTHDDTLLPSLEAAVDSIRLIEL
jgi:hypothetical protein